MNKNILYFILFFIIFLLFQNDYFYFSFHITKTAFIIIFLLNILFTYLALKNKKFYFIFFILAIITYIILTIGILEEIIYIHFNNPNYNLIRSNYILLFLISNLILWYSISLYLIKNNKNNKIGIILLILPCIYLILDLIFKLLLFILPIYFLYFILIDILIFLAVGQKSPTQSSKIITIAFLPIFFF